MYFESTASGDLAIDGLLLSRAACIGVQYWKHKVISYSTSLWNFSRICSRTFIVHSVHHSSQYCHISFICKLSTLCRWYSAFHIILYLRHCTQYHSSRTNYIKCLWLDVIKPFSLNPSETEILLTGLSQQILKHSNHYHSSAQWCHSLTCWFC